MPAIPATQRATRLQLLQLTEHVAYAVKAYAAHAVKTYAAGVCHAQHTQQQQ